MKSVTSSCIFEFLEIIVPRCSQERPVSGPRNYFDARHAVPGTALSNVTRERDSRDKPFLPFTPPPFLLRLETAIDWAATANPSAIRSIWPANVALDGWTDRLLPSNTKKLTSRFYSNPLPSARFSGHDLFARPYGNTPCSRLETQIFHWLLDFVLMFVTKMSGGEEGRGDSLRETVWNNVVGGVIKRRVSFSLI